MKPFAKFIQCVVVGALAWVVVPSLLVVGEVRPATPKPRSVAASCDPTRSVQVTGAATVNIVPDRALIRLGVQSNGSTIDAVENANSAAIQRVLEALSGQGVDAKDISTDIYVVEPLYDSYDSLYIKGYRIHNEVAITLRDVKNTSVLVSAALKAGANQVNDVEFYTSELRKYRDQARGLAVTAAKEKAQALASAAGAETGCVISITENTTSNYNGWWYGRNQNLWSQNTIQNVSPSEGSSSASDEPITLGQISVKAEVSATFSLR